MKILIGYINNNLAGGIDKYIMRFVNSIDNKNIQIDFLTKSDENDFHKELKKKGHKVFKVSRNKKFFQAIKETETIIKENNYDIVYANISESFDCTGLIAAKRANVKKRIVHSHSSSKVSSSLVKTVIIRVLQFLFRPVIYHNANYFLACSTKAASWMFPRKVVKNKQYEIINNSIDHKRFVFNESNRIKIRKKHNIENKYVLGFIGRFSKEKNIYFLVDILKEVIKTKDAVLLMVGKGELQDEFTNYINNTDIKDRVIIAGPSDHPEEYYSAFDVFLLPSIYEGLPIVGVEAQFNNLPCIFSSNISDEVIISENSYLESIKKPIYWANRINNIKERTNKLNKRAEKFKIENDDFNDLLDLNNCMR